MWLPGVIPDHEGTAEAKGSGRQRPIGSFVQVAHDVTLSFAASTGTGPPYLFQGNKNLAAIFPFDGQFFSNRFDVQRSHK